MNTSVISSISSADLVDAKLEQHQMLISKRCPSCGHLLDPKPDWLGLPAGVKFDPTDQELIEHLKAKVEVENLNSHPLIDEFIPTIEGEDGICYTHPEKLPGVSKDGLSRHFFHRPSKAYTTGTRKRRKIQAECDLQGSETRWHKTGKTRPVMAAGKQKGCKKILVLYTNFGKQKKPEKTNWVMHQYHLGQSEEEKEGELVVSKVFYQTQPRQCNWLDKTASGESTEQRRKTGSISCPHKDGLSSVGIPKCSVMDIRQMKSESFSFDPLGKSFTQVGMGEASNSREASASTCEHHEETELQKPHHMTHERPLATAAYPLSRPSIAISTIAPQTVHQTSIALDDPYQLSGLILEGENFQNESNATTITEGFTLSHGVLGCNESELFFIG